MFRLWLERRRSAGTITRGRGDPRSDPKTESGRRGTRYFRTRDLPGGGTEELPNTPTGQRKAQALLEDYLRDRDQEEARLAADRLDPFLWEVVERFLAHVGETKAERTLEVYGQRLNVVQRFVGADGVEFGRRRIGSLTLKDGARMVAHWARAGHSGNYITNGLLLTAKACLNWAAAVDPAREPTQIIVSNPWDALRGPEAGQAERNLIARGDLAAFLRSAWVQANAWRRDLNHRCAGCRRAGTVRTRRCVRSHSARQILARHTVLLIRCQYHCGTRPGELCKARWDGWNPRANRSPKTGQWWGMLRMVGKNTRKKKRLREVPVRPSLVRAIERIRALPWRHPEYIFAHLTKERGRVREQPAQAVWPPRVAPWGTSTALAQAIRLWRVAGLAAAQEAEAERLVRSGLSAAEATERAKLAPPPFDPSLTLYTLRHTFYTDAIEGGETFERAGAVGDTGAATIEKTYFRHRQRARFETAERIAAERKRDE